MTKMTLRPLPHEDALILGHGGGFTLAFEELAMLPSGRVELTSFVCDYDGEPVDVETARLFMLPTEVYQRFVDELARIDFTSITLPEPESNLVEYLSHTQQGIGTHTIVWSRGQTHKLPAVIAGVVRGLRGLFLAEFDKVFGLAAGDDGSGRAAATQED